MLEMTSARVPSEIRRQGNEILHRIGSSPSELINAAYAYVIQTGELPSAAPKTPEETSRVPDADLLARIEDSMERTSFAIPETYWDGRTYKELIADGRREAYEGLA